MADKFILQFKAEVLHLGEATLIKYLKVGLHQLLFKSIYQCLVMPTTLKSWYDWAFKLDWQYCQEQAESHLLHSSSHVGSKFGKAAIIVMWEPKALPAAMAVTLPSQG